MAIEPLFYACAFIIKQPTNILKMSILSQTSILYFIRHASFILTVGLILLRRKQQANIVGREIMAHSGLEPATFVLHARHFPTWARRADV